jgi:hypothetical protein
VNGPSPIPPAQLVDGSYSAYIENAHGPSRIPPTVLVGARVRGRQRVEAKVAVLSYLGNRDGMRRNPERVVTQALDKETYRIRLSAEV